MCDILKQSQATVYKKLNGEINFTATDIYRLVKKLEIPKRQIVRYFFTIANNNKVIPDETTFVNTDIKSDDDNNNAD